MIFNTIAMGASGGGSAPDLLMKNGHVSNNSDYLTATFDSSVNLADYDFVEVLFYRTLGAYVGENVVLVPTTSVTFDIVGGRYTYTMDLTPTTITCSSYAGSFVNCYVDVYGYKGQAPA